MAGEPRDRCGRLLPADDPDVVLEIQRVDGIEGRRLRARQARVLRELARNSSNDGQQPAA